MPEYRAARSRAGLDPKTRTQSYEAEVEHIIMLNAFEQELDALNAILDTEQRNKAVSESIIRRYATAEEIMEDIEASMSRIRLKMMVAQDKMMGGLGGRRVLEDAGKTDQETA